MVHDHHAGLVGSQDLKKHYNGVAFLGMCVGVLLQAHGLHRFSDTCVRIW